KFVFTALNQIADIVDIFSFQAVGRTYSQLQVVHWTKQNRVNLRRMLDFDFSWRTFKISKYSQLTHQDTGGITNSLLRLDNTIRFYIHHKLIQVGTLFHPGTLNMVAHLVDRAE